MRWSIVAGDKHNEKAQDHGVGRELMSAIVSNFQVSLLTLTPPRLTYLMSLKKPNLHQAASADLCVINVTLESPMLIGTDITALSDEPALVLLFG